MKKIINRPDKLMTYFEKDKVLGNEDAPEVLSPNGLYALIF